MENLTFVPLAFHSERSASLLPDAYLNDMYARGRAELMSALDVNVLGLPREVSDPAPNKWFGSEMYLANLLSKIMERATDCEILDSKYLEALDKVKKCAKAPCWVQNRDSHRNQLYALLAHDAHKRVMKRFMTLPTTGIAVRTIINDCSFQRGFLGELDAKTEATFIFWAKSGGLPHTVNNAFWSKEAFRRMHRAVYEQSYREFLRRGPFSRQYRNFEISDQLSQRYTYPQVVPGRKWHENLGIRLSRFGVEPTNPPNAQATHSSYTMDGWRHATDLTEWTDTVSNEEQASNNEVVNVSFDLNQTDSDTRQGEDRIHRSGVTREDIMNAVQAPNEPTMLERAAEAARAAGPALDEFTEACNNFTRQVGRAEATFNGSVQNVERLREEWIQMEQNPVDAAHLTPTPEHEARVAGLDRAFDLHGIELRRMTREQIEAQSEGTQNWIHLGADPEAEPVFDESTELIDAEERERRRVERETAQSLRDEFTEMDEVARIRAELDEAARIRAELATELTAEVDQACANLQNQRDRTESDAEVARVSEERELERSREIREEWLYPRNRGERL